MTKALDNAAIDRAFRAAERALAQGDPDTLAGRFSPTQPKAAAPEKKREATRR